MPGQVPRSLVPLFLTLLALHVKPGSAVAYRSSDGANDTDFIRTNCNETRYPDLCYASLSPYASAVQQNSGQLAKVAIAVSLDTVRGVANYLTNLTRESNVGAQSRAAGALRDCCSNLRDALYRTACSLKQMRQLGASAGDGSESGTTSFSFQMSNVQTWLSAALTDEETCTDGFYNVPDEPPKRDVSDRVDSVKKLTSNALALVNVFASKGSA